ncbi:hypothetical protein [Rhodocyclus tenuis]|uniref:hypothetical protein n=1 Tax=Rhodocyclus tenuis TaxID=1066 RepID=UPI0030B88802
MCFVALNGFAQASHCCYRVTRGEQRRAERIAQQRAVARAAEQLFELPDALLVHGFP